MAPDLSHIRTWIFDLDNTLYSANTEIFPRIHVRMEEYIKLFFNCSAEEASARRDFYFHEYGTSLRGLMMEERIDPDHFLDFCHDVDISCLEPATELAELIEGLPGKKLIFTNSDNRHTKRILEKLALHDHFDGIFDIADGAYICKPQRAPYEKLLQKYSAEAETACMFDDMEANLREAAGLGMTTVWLRHEASWLRKKPGPPKNYPHCHHVTDDLTPFLRSFAPKAKA